VSSLVRRNNEPDPVLFEKRHLRSNTTTRAHVRRWPCDGAVASVRENYRGVSIARWFTRAGRRVGAAVVVVVAQDSRACASHVATTHRACPPACVYLRIEPPRLQGATTRFKSRQLRFSSIPCRPAVRLPVATSRTAGRRHR